MYKHNTINTMDVLIQRQRFFHTSYFSYKLYTIKIKLKLKFKNKKHIQIIFNRQRNVVVG